MFENMLLMNWYDDYAYWWFGDESCCCCGIIMKVLWIFELGQNGVWFMSFEYSWVCVYVFDL